MVVLPQAQATVGFWPMWAVGRGVPLFCRLCGASVEAMALMGLRGPLAAGSPFLRANRHECSIIYSFAHVFFESSEDQILTVFKSNVMF